ncbi:hypothetical protein Tco_1263279, partial [Tanacetum coccineum]
MANLEFCDTHNMVAYLHKTEESEGFHQIVDFLNTSYIKYALTENPTIHVSLIQQFWQTATANTLDSGEVQITATIDGKVKLVSEASIRRHLKLEDSDGITTLPNIEIFEQLTLMRTYIAPTLTQKLVSNMRRASKGYTGVGIPLFPTMLVQGLILQGKGSRVLVESHHTPSGAPTTSQPPLSSPSRIPTRQETEVSQPSSPTHTNVADEVAFTSMDVGKGSRVLVESHHTPSGAPTTSQPPLSSPSRIPTRQETEVKKLEQTVKTSQTRRRAKIIVLDDKEGSEDTS